jgi:hypothetical protein
MRAFGGAPGQFDWIFFRPTTDPIRLQLKAVHADHLFSGCALPTSPMHWLVGFRSGSKSYVRPRPMV